MFSQLYFLLNLVKELRSTNSSNEKKVVLLKYYDLNNNYFNSLLDLVYSYDKKFWVSSDNVLKMSEKKFSDISMFDEEQSTFSDSQDLIDVLSQLTNRIITGHNAIKYLIKLISLVNSENQE